MRALLLVCVVLGGCGSGAVPHGIPPLASDTVATMVQGIVEIVGTEPQSTVQLRTTSAEIVAVDGEVSELRRAVGLEVRITGRVARDANAVAPEPARRITLGRFEVYAVDGRAATDGILAFRDGTWSVVRYDGSRRTLSAVPSALQSQIGARIYWVGTMSEAPQAYGILRPAPPPD